MYVCLHPCSLAPLHPPVGILQDRPPPRQVLGYGLQGGGSLASVRTLSGLNQKTEHIENQIVANLNGLRKYKTHDG